MFYTLIFKDFRLAAIRKMQSIEQTTITFDTFVKNTHNQRRCYYDNLTATITMIFMFTVLAVTNCVFGQLTTLTSFHCDVIVSVQKGQRYDTVAVLLFAVILALVESNADRHDRHVTNIFLIASLSFLPPFEFHWFGPAVNNIYSVMLGLA